MLPEGCRVQEERCFSHRMFCLFNVRFKGLGSVGLQFKDYIGV